MFLYLIQTYHIVGNFGKVFNLVIWRIFFKTLTHMRLWRWAFRSPNCSPNLPTIWYMCAYDEHSDRLMHVRLWHWAFRSPNCSPKLTSYNYGIVHNTLFKHTNKALGFWHHKNSEAQSLDCDLHQNVLPRSTVMLHVVVGEPSQRGCKTNP